MDDQLGELAPGQVIEASEESALYAKTSELVETTKQTTMTSIDTAFALAAALAWTEAIKEIIKGYTNNGSGTKPMIMYAVVVTLIYAVYNTLFSKQASSLLLMKKRA